MIAINAKQAIQELLSYTIVTDKGSLVELLKRYGVKFKDNPSDAEVTTAVLVANKKSKPFRKDLAKLLQNKLPIAGEKFKSIVGNDQDFGFTGVDDVTYEPNFSWTGTDDFNDFTGWDDFQAADGKGKTSVTIPSDLLTRAKASAAQASQIASQQKGKTRIGKALANLWSFSKDKVLTKENVNAGIQYGLDKINQDSLRRQNALEQQSLLLQAQQDQMRGKFGRGLSGNTVLYASVGIIALVGIGFLIYKQSKK